MEERTMRLDDFNIDVKCYLGYDEIQHIVNTTMPIENWNNRQENIDLLVLHYAAGIPVEELNNTDPDVYLKSGLVYAVRNCVVNYDDIAKGIEYHTSISKLLYELTSKWPEIQKSITNSPQFKEMISNANN